MNDNPPRVSVIVPVYNHERYLSDTIESILGQTFTDFELLMVDDGSTDGSREVARAYKGSRVRLISNERNLGQPKTRNRAVQLVRGAYIAMLDSDDIAYPQRLGRQVAFLERNPDHALIGSWRSVMDAQGRPLRTPKQWPVRAEEIGAWALFRCPIIHSSVMARAAVLKANPYCEQFRLCADFELYARLLANGYKLGNLREALVRYRKHPGGISQAATNLEAKNEAERAVFRAQLTALDIAFTEQDLTRHAWLYRRPHTGGQRWVPDHAYLEWAACWLLDLIRANHRVCRYSPRELERVIKRCWFKLCRQASTRLGWRAWWQYWRSPLRVGYGR